MKTPTYAAAKLPQIRTELSCVARRGSDSLNLFSREDLMLSVTSVVNEIGKTTKDIVNCMQLDT